MATVTNFHSVPEQHMLIGRLYRDYPRQAAAGGATLQPVPIAEDIEGGAIGAAYSETISAQGGTSPYTFSLASGSLPAGLSLSGGGVISGTPTTAGTSTFTITVTDANGSTGSQTFQITIAAAGGASNYAFVA